MSIQTFPEIESFQKLPRQVIVKGGELSQDDNQETELRGIVINNIGHAIRDIKVNVVLFNERKIPILNTSVVSNPNHLQQGGIAPFYFRFKNMPLRPTDFHLYLDWRFDEH